MTTPSAHQEIPFAQHILDGCPIPMQIYRTDGLMVATNRTSEQFWKAPREIMVGNFNMVTDPQNVELGIPRVFERVAQGEVVTLPPVVYDSSQLPFLDESVRLWVEVIYFPIANDTGAIHYVGVIHRDVTGAIEHQERMEAAREEIDMQRTTIQQLEAAHQEIAAQRQMIAVLSSPVIQVWEGILTMPLVGIIDARRATTITEALLEAIVHLQAECVILDITGVVEVDTQVASYLVSAARACQLLGCEVALVGIGSQIARTLVDLDINLAGIITRANLQAGIAWAFERQNLSVVQAHPVRHRRTSEKEKHQ